jgi:hypothetical protein
MTIFQPGGGKKKPIFISRGGRSPPGGWIKMTAVMVSFMS